MTNAQKEYQRRSLYNHPASKEARAKEEGRGAKPSPVAMLRTKQRGEKQELIQRHRQESAKFEHELNVEESHRVNHGEKPVAASHESSPESRREKIVARHQKESGALSDRHDHELEAAMKKHPVA
jgi:hypothetical protein